MQETFLLKILSKVVLFLVVKFIYSTIKMTFQKKEKPRRRRFANFKKICIWGLGEHQQAWKGISLSPACNRCTIDLYTIFVTFNYLIIYLFTSKIFIKIFIIFTKNRLYFNFSIFIILLNMKTIFLYILV